MPNSVELNLSEYLRRRFSLPYSLGTAGGLDAIYLGAFPLHFDDEECQEYIAAVVDSCKAQVLPRFTMDPLGFAFSICAVSSRKPLLSRLAATRNWRDRLELLRNAPWNSFHLGLCRASLNLLSATCVENEIDGVTDFSGDLALVNRLKQQAVHLFIPPDSQVSLEAHSETSLREEALARLKQIQPGFRINKNWEKAKIFRRARESTIPSEDVFIRLKLQLPPVTRLHLRKLAIEDELHDVNSLYEADLAAAAQDNSLGARQSRSRRISCGFSAMPHLGGVTESGLNSLRAWTLRNWRHDDVALLLAIEDITHLCDESLDVARIEGHGSAAYIVTPCPYLTENAPVPSGLHLAVGDAFWRPIPPDIEGEAARILNCRDKEKLLLARDVLLRDKFHTSFTRLKQAWLYHAPVWDNTTWTSAEFGLNLVRFDENGKLKMPGYRSYLVWDPAIHEARILNSIANRGWKIEADPAVGDIPKCGSRNCPSPTLVAELVTTLDNLLTMAMAQMPQEYLELACLLNAIASLARLLEVFLTFARSYPAESPRVIRESGGFELLEPILMKREKIRQRPLVYCFELRRMLETVALIFAKAFAILCQRRYLLERGGESESEDFSYSFLPHRTHNNIIRLQHPKKSLVVSGLLHHSTTEKFGLLATNGMRNLNYYLLTSMPAHEFEIMDLCDHLPTGGSGTLNRGCAVSVANINVRENAAQALIREPSKWPWR